MNRISFTIDERRKEELRQIARLLEHRLTIIFTVFTIWHIAKRKRLSVK